MLSDVCLSVSRTSGLSREQRGLYEDQNWHRGSPRHTWLGHHFQGQNVEGHGHQAALLTAVLARQAAAAVGVGTCWPWKTAAMLLSAWPREEENGGGISWRPPAYSLFCYYYYYTLPIAGALSDDAHLMSWRLSRSLHRAYVKNREA